MKVSHIVLSIWLATFSFCVLQILFGPTGLTETQRLKDQHERLSERLVELQDENQRLVARYEALRTSVEEVRLEARSLGWFGPTETPVRTLDGSSLRLPSEDPDLSSVPPLASRAAESSFFFRVAWLLLFLSFWTLFTLAGRLWPSGGPTVRALVSKTANLPVPLQTGLDFFRK